jgi:hypothetical protein
MARRNPNSTGYVAAKIRANTARRNSKLVWEEIHSLGHDRVRWAAHLPGEGLRGVVFLLPPRLSPALVYAEALPDLGPTILTDLALPTSLR